MKESTDIECPICNMTFRDKRGLTSHARNKHDLGKDEVFEKMTQKEQEKKEWEILGGVGALLLALITLGKSK